MRSYYTSQLNTPFLLIFWQNLDVDATKASETVQVRNFISSNYIVISLMPCGIFLLRIMLLETQLISFFWSCFLNSNKQRVEVTISLAITLVNNLYKARQYTLTHSIYLILLLCSVSLYTKTQDNI